MGKNFGLVIDLRKCIECHACVVGCKIHNQIIQNNIKILVGGAPFTAEYAKEIGADGICLGFDESSRLGQGTPGIST